MSEQFSKKTMLEVINQYLDDGYTNLEAIQESATNTDYYIIGTYKAIQSLEAFDSEDMMIEDTQLEGVFGAIEYVKDYLVDELGTPLDPENITNPEWLATMVAYINIENVGRDIIDWLDDKESDNDVNDIDQAEYEEDLSDDEIAMVKKYIKDNLEDEN
jgi:hypothetical protein